MILAKNTVRGQIIFVVLFGIISISIFALFVISGNVNYLNMILFGVVIFTPVFHYSVRFYDILIDRDTIIIYSLLKRKIVKLDFFKEITPASDVLVSFKSQYYSFVLKDGKKYNFVYRLSIKEKFKYSQKEISKKLTAEVKSLLTPSGISN